MYLRQIYLNFRDSHSHKIKENTGSSQLLTTQFKNQAKLELCEKDIALEPVLTLMAVAEFGNHTILFGCFATGKREAELIENVEVN